MASSNGLPLLLLLLLRWLWIDDQWAANQRSVIESHFLGGGELFQLHNWVFAWRGVEPTRPAPHVEADGLAVGVSCPLNLRALVARRSERD